MLEGQVVIVTGASKGIGRGIGRGIAEYLVDQDVKLTVTSRKQERIEATATEGRDGDPIADIAPVIGFLLSDASQYVTGETFQVDGGGLMRP